MYDRAVREGVPFNQYAIWIQRELTRVYLERAYTESALEASNERSDRAYSVVPDPRTRAGTKLTDAARKSTTTGSTADTTSAAAEKFLGYKTRVVAPRKGRFGGS